MALNKKKVNIHDLMSVSQTIQEELSNYQNVTDGEIKAWNEVVLEGDEE